MDSAGSPLSTVHCSLSILKGTILILRIISLAFRTLLYIIIPNFMKYLPLLLLLCVSVEISAQIRVGVIGGPHAANIQETHENSSFSPLYKGRSTMHLGLLFDMPLNDGNRWSLQPALLYMPKGRKLNKLYDTSQNATDTLQYMYEFHSNYIEIPLHLTYKIPLSEKSHFFIGGGPYVAAFFDGKQLTETRKLTGATTTVWSSESVPLEAGNAPDKIKTFDVGISARAGFTLNKFIISGFFTRGLQNFYTNTYPNSSKHQVAGASIGFWLNDLQTAPKDTDGDGIPDKDDACPLLAGPAALQGCPDMDGDGIPDKDDACPGIAGIAKYKGCPIPDTDGDGINDEEDACPTQPGIAKYKGCPIPDTDRDGLNDEEDACPTVPGPLANKGCPWPDTDGDGVPDHEDACPLTPGLPELNGCQPIDEKIIEQVKLTAANIYFETASEKLKKESLQGLNDLVKILESDTSLIITIEGHTDNVGQAENNLKLSDRRANAVQTYLVEKGISAERIKSIGYGSEKPIADNNTADGRAKNRRVEIVIKRK